MPKRVSSLDGSDDASPLPSLRCFGCPVVRDLLLLRRLLSFRPACFPWGFFFDNSCLRSEKPASPPTTDLRTRPHYISPPETEVPPAFTGTGYPIQSPLTTRMDFFFFFFLFFFFFFFFFFFSSTTICEF